jgi:predicted DNA-binding transcriptional regulator
LPRQLEIRRLTAQTRRSAFVKRVAVARNTVQPGFYGSL